MDRAQEEFNEMALRDFILFAWSQDEAHAAFRGATGRPQQPKTGSFLDAMIDKACGVEVNDKYIEEFIEWVTKTHWGENFAPEKWRNKFRSQAVNI